MHDPTTHQPTEPTTDTDARLIDSLAHGDQLPPGSDRVAELLAAWRDEVRAEPLPPLPTIPAPRSGDDR